VGDQDGQQAVVKALYELIGIAESDEDLDEIERQNADRITKFGTRIRAEFNDEITKKRTALAERGVR
jgi:DnaJ-domain-containing protein 1